MSGLTLTTVSGYVCGNREPYFGSLVKIAKTLDVSLDWLCGLRDGMEDE